MEHAPTRRQFASDNRSGICPEAWAALQAANEAHAPSYGDDADTQRAADLLRETFETDCDVYFVFTGTAANGLALASLCQSYHSVICHQWSHIETDECGAPEFFSNGTKLLLAEGANGKLTVGAVESFTKRIDIHFPKPRVISVTQATELATVYTPAELTNLCTRAKQLGLSVHMDGARFANAVASLGCTPAEITWKCGVDVLCFGGTKNGMLAGEAVVFFDRAFGAEFAYRCKQAGQLASKMRFMTAQWAGMLHERAWLRRASHANRMAKRLENQLQRVPGVRVMFPVEANGVFVEIPPNLMAALRERGWDVYNFIAPGGARFMCSWDTSEADVDRLVEDFYAVPNA